MKNSTITLKVAKEISKQDELQKKKKKKIAGKQKVRKVEDYSKRSSIQIRKNLERGNRQNEKDTSITEII